MMDILYFIGMIIKVNTICFKNMTRYKNRQTYVIARFCIFIITHKSNNVEMKFTFVTNVKLL